MIGFEPGYEARVVADEVRFNIPDYLLQAALDASYAAKDHTHPVSQITGLEGALTSYLTRTAAASTYEPLITNSITLNDADIDKDDARFYWLNLAGAKFRASWNGIRSKLKAYFDGIYQPKGDYQPSGSYAPLSHTHTIAQVTNLQSTLDGKITKDGRAYPRLSYGGDLNFNWSGQSGQPKWLWGGSDGTNMYVYNPDNFNVNSVGGQTQAQIWARIELRAQQFADDRINQAWWRCRDYMNSEFVPVGHVAMVRVRAGTNASFGRGANVGGIDLMWSNSVGGGTEQIMYGTWLILSSNVSATAGLARRVG